MKEHTAADAATGAPTMDMGQKVQLLEGVLAAVVDRALGADGLPAPVVRLALADIAHAVRELERQRAERRAAQQRQNRRDTIDGEPKEA